MITKERLNLNWDKDFTKEHKKALNRFAIEEIFNFISGYIDRQQESRSHEVLNSFPGHGKTAVLKIIIQKMIDQKHLVGGLIVLRETEQMREMEQFLCGRKYGVLYVDADNYQEVRPHLSKYQFVIISHERLRNLVLSIRGVNSSPDPYIQGIEKVDEIVRWKNKKRLILIDEAPSFVDHAVFEIDMGVSWLDECFQAAYQEFSSEEIIMVRSLFQILLAKELLENKNPLTGALKDHLDSQQFTKVLTKFFNTVDRYFDRIASPDSQCRYQWLKKLYFQNHSGYIDSGVYINNYSDHKKIICSQRIDYRKLGCSILILDGTALYTKTLYNNEYVITSLTNYTKYERMHIHQRNINTSARKRKTSSGIPVQEIIARDIEKIKDRGIIPFPLMDKFEVDIYLKLKVISKNTYQKFFSLSSERNALPINLLNTTGKNYLANQSSLYLTSLPIRPASHYKAVAISLYKDKLNPLNLSMNQRDKIDSSMWFADNRIETVYLECLLSEMIQIIHRSDIRNLSLPSHKKVDIFIANNYDHILDNLVKLFEKPIHFNRSYVESMTKFRQSLEVKIESISERIRKENIVLPNKIGKIEVGSSLKNLVNKNWNDKVKREEIIASFKRYGLSIYEIVNNSGKKEKSIGYLK